MNCFYEVVLGCCHSRNSCPRHYYYAAGGQSVALLIYGFPRIYHSLSEFTDLLYLLSRYDANCTFFLAWDDLKKRGMTPIVREIIRSINIEGHEVALHFRHEICGHSTAQLRQDAAEALHFVQRVFGTTVRVAKVSCVLPDAATALESLGLTIVENYSGSRIVSFCDDAKLMQNVESTLDVLTYSQRPCVRLDTLLDEI